MKIGRKEALLALVATMIPWAGRKASAQERLQATPRQQQSPEMAELQRRVAALEAQLSTQVGFTRDAVGNLSVRSAGTVTIDASSSMMLKSGGIAELRGAGAVAVRGATISLN
jgi:hypothetical protein